MTAHDNPNQLGPDAGLCAHCVHLRRVASARDSVFILCQLSATDPRFPKYPRLPVFSCIGYAPVSVNPKPQ